MAANMEKPALIVIDMLNDFLDQWDRELVGRLVEAINKLVRTMRGCGLPVIWVRQEFEPDLSDAFAEMRDRDIRMTIRGTRGCQIVDALEVLAGDPVVIKKRYSAFFKTDLDALLAKMAPDALILAGINTHACIRTAAIDAYQRDWRVVLAMDCIDSYDREHHDVSLRYMKDRIAAAMTNEEIRLALKDQVRKG